MKSEVFSSLWRRRKLFIAVFSLTLLATLTALAVLPVRYVATSSVIVAEQEPGGSEPSATWAQKMGDPADLESQLLLVRSPRVLRMVRDDPNALEAVRQDCNASSGRLAGLFPAGDAARKCDLLVKDPEAFIGYVQDHDAVASIGRSRVIDISYQSVRPDVAQTMANAIVSAFLDDQRLTLSKSRENAAAWLWKEVGTLDGAMKTEEAKIQEFRRTNGLLRGANAPITSERLTNIGQQLSVAEAARSEAAARLAEITAGQGGGSGSAPAVLSSRAIGDLKQQLTLVTSQLANNAMVLGPSHPTIMALKRERDSVQTRIAREIATITASARQILDADTAQVASLRRQMEALKADAGAATAAEASIADMLRDVEVKRAQYTDLYKRASELETERRVLAGSTRLVHLADLPIKPFFPKTVPFLAAGLTLAMVFATAAALLRDRIDGSLRTRASLAQIGGVPVLARLPEIRLPHRAGFADLLRRRPAEGPFPDALDAARRDPGLQDGLRGLFAKLAIAKGSAKTLSVLVTSTMPREGKTLTTLALAALVAASGRRVLAIECDMRGPVFDGLLGLEPGPGLNAVLRGVLRPRDVVVKTGIPNFDAIPGGRAVSDSTELLLGDHMAHLLRWAAQYDLVLIDSPPAGLLMDTCILAPQVDWVLCCVRWGRSRLDAAEATVRMLKAAGCGALGMVVTSADADATAFHDPQATAAPVRRVLGAEAA